MQEILVAIVRSQDQGSSVNCDDYLSGHDNYSHGYHKLEGHLQRLGLTSGQHSSTDYSSTGEYSTSNAEYQDFRYYHHRADIAAILL